MFIHYNRKHKRNFIILKGLVLIGILLALFFAGQKAMVKLPTTVEKWSFGVGFASVGVIGALAYLNRLKALFKIKSAGFVILFAILLLLSVSIEALLWASGLVCIPLLIDDIFVSGYLGYINNKYYWDFYKYKNLSKPME